MKLPAFVTVVLCLCWSLQSSGEDNGDFDPELEDLSAQYAECAAYFRLAYFALMNSGAEESAGSIREVEDSMMLVALALASVERDQDMAVEVTNSRIEFSMKMMKQEINNRNENFSILMNKYQLPCQEKLTNPKERVADALSRFAG